MLFVLIFLVWLMGVILEEFFYVILVGFGECYLVIRGLFGVEQDLFVWSCWFWMVDIELDGG